MDLSGTPKQQLIDMVITLASSINEEDLENPETFALASQLTQLLSGKAEPLPAAMVEQLEKIPDKAQRFRQAAQMMGLSRASDLDRLAGSLKAAGLINNEETRIPSQPGSHPHAYPWHDHDEEEEQGEEVQKAEVSHPHLQAHGPAAQNEQAGGNHSGMFHQLMNHFGTVTPGRKSNLRFYEGIHHHESGIDQHIAEAGYQHYFAGGKYGKPDLIGKNYNTKHLMIYDPSPSSGGDFNDESFTRAWRKAHEKAHADTYGAVNEKYGEGRRLGKLGVRSLREMRRAIHWEHLAVHRQREIMESLGHKISDQDFNREYNTVMGDAVHRAITGQFTDPSEMGFEPHSHQISLEHAMGLLEGHAKKLGLRHEDDTLAQLRSGTDMKKSLEELLKAAREILEKGKNGDWEKEGYSFKLHTDDWETPEQDYPYHQSSFNITAHDKGGREVAHAEVYHDRSAGPGIPSKLHVSDVLVDEDHRRKGLANAMYSLAEKVSGKKLTPYSYQYEDGKALWAQPKRPFGKSESSLEKGQDEFGKPIRGSNKRLQQAKTFGKPSDAKKDKKGVWQPKIPDANGARTSEQRQKMMSAIKGFAEKRYGAEMTTASGKRDETGKLKEKATIATEPYDVFSKEGVAQEKIRNQMIGKINETKSGKKVKRTDPKPDWRSGKLETQPSPDAAIHELAHLERHRDGAGLGQIQTEMDKEWGASNQKYKKHNQQKKTAGEIQPMAMENPIRRQIGLPANRSSKKTDTSKPVAQAIDGSGPRFNRAKIKGKKVDLDRQSRLMNEESRTRIEQNANGERKFSPTKGWQQSDGVHAKINARAAGRRTIREDAKKEKVAPEKTRPDDYLAASEAKVSKLKDRLAKAKKR